MSEEGQHHCLVDGVIVVECEQSLNAEQRNHLTQHIEHTFPERKALVLDGGLRLHVSQQQAIERIEAMLAYLIDKLDLEGDGEEEQADPHRGL